MKALPTFEEVSAVLRHENGVLIWKRTWGRATAGEPAGGKNRFGYMRVSLRHREYSAHRVVWLLEHGEWPTKAIDHRNGIRDDNRPENLRLCTNGQNQQNRRVGGKVPFKGVVEHSGKFQATCARKYLGFFDTPEEAARAYDAAATARFGEFAKLNFGASA